VEKSGLFENEDLTMQFKIQFLEEVIGIDEIDINEVPTVLIDYYIELKLKNLL